MHVSDGRSFVRNSHDQYDVVQMTLVDTWASTAAGAFALSENNLYTVEAFREYFEHLKPDGMIAITRWEFAKPREALRVVSQAMEALHELGVEDSSQNFIVVSDGSLDSDGRPVLVLAKKTPFTLEEQQAVLNHIEGADGNGANLNLHVLYMPATGGSARHGASGVRETDSRPGSAELLGDVSLQRHAGHRQRAVLLLHPEAGAGLSRLGCGRHRLEGEPRHRHPGHRADRLDCGGAVVSGAAAGAVAGNALGAQLARAVLHRDRPGLHHGGDRLHPALRALPRISDVRADGGVFLMLLSSGAGSLVSRKWFSEPTRVSLALAFIVIALATYVFALPHLLEAMIGLPFAAKLVMSALLLVPLGFAMGMPFPSGLRALSLLSSATSRAKHGAVEWAWAMNAASSVLGSVLAIVIAIQFGSTTTLACAAAGHACGIAAWSLVTLREKKPCQPGGNQRRIVDIRKAQPARIAASARLPATAVADAVQNNVAALRLFHPARMSLSC